MIPEEELHDETPGSPNRDVAQIPDMVEPNFAIDHLEVPDHPLEQLHFIAYALNNRDGLGMFFLNGAGILMDVARQNDRRNAWMKVAIPDEMAKNLKGNRRLVDAYCILRIPAETLQAFQSPVEVLPEKKVILTDG